MCVKRFSLEEFGEKWDAMVMWTFFFCLRETGKKFLTAQKIGTFHAKIIGNACKN